VHAGFGHAKTIVLDPRFFELLRLFTALTVALFFRDIFGASVWPEVVELPLGLVALFRAAEPGFNNPSYRCFIRSARFFDILKAYATSCADPSCA
jgi:hypothetical protein